MADMSAEGAGMRSLAATRAERFGIGLDRAPVPISVWRRAEDGEFRVADINEAGCRMSARPREELVGQTIEVFGPNHPRGRRDMTHAAATKSAVTREIVYTPPDREPVQLQVVYAGVGPDEVIVFVHDMTAQRWAEERLRVTEDRYRALISAANEGLWLVDTEGHTSFANDRVRQILGRSRADVTGGNLLDFVDKRDRASVAGALACPRDTPDAFEARFRHSDGRELLCLISVSPMPGNDLTPATLCVLADMSAVQQERDLRHTLERRFQRMVETAHEAIWTGDKDGNTTFINEAGARALGVPADELIGRPLTELIVYDDKAKALRAQIRRDGKPLDGELRVRRPDGALIDVLASISLMRDDAGETVGSLAMITDITQLKREQAELRESNERFSHVFERAPVGMVFLGAGHMVRGRFMAANAAFRGLLGYTEDELRARDIFDLTHADDVELERTLVHELFKHQRDHYTLDKRFVRKDGSPVWTRFRVHITRDGAGAPLYCLGVAVDIGAERKAFDAAAHYVARAHAVLDASRDAVIEVADDGHIVDANGASLRMVGRERSELLGRPLAAALVPERLQPHASEALDDWLRTARAGSEVEATEAMLVRADGSEFRAGLRITPLPGTGGTRLFLHIRNLGAEESADTARREAQERFERLFRDGAAPSVTIDLRGRLTDVNPAFCKLAGREARALIGRDASEVLTDAGDPRDAPWHTGVDRPGPTAAVSRRVVAPGGRSVVVHLTASLLRNAAGAPVEWLCQCLPELPEPESPWDGEPLSYRERQVLGLLASGHDGPAIAERLGLAPETVRSYAHSARDKLGAKTRTEAVARALAYREITL